MEFKVKGHKTPVLTKAQKDKSALEVLYGQYGHLLRECGFCGGYTTKGLVCSCGFDKGYADELDEDGNLVEVYFKVF